MKLKSSFLIIILSFFHSFSQTGRQVYGKIVSNELALQSIDVVNLSTKKSATSDKNGVFNIEATINETLYFISKDYHDIKIKITHENLNKKLIINLIKKPIEIEEVKIDNKLKFNSVANYNDIKIAKIEKDLTKAKVIGVYTGEMVNAIDFVQIGKSIWKLLKGKKKKPISIEEEIDYQKFIESVFNEDFFVKSLHLNPDQINPFLDYVLTDKSVLEVISKKNKFEMMNVLIIKNKEFVKLK
ncbi:hypothetical protein [Flavobacterium sp.]|uniref:hypothetical protein n=1 Tax=Flavobacterium sp. TaxID=239 RepID=UPI0037517A39